MTASLSAANGKSCTNRTNRNAHTSVPKTTLLSLSSIPGFFLGFIFTESFVEKSNEN